MISAWSLSCFWETKQKTVQVKEQVKSKHGPTLWRTTCLNKELLQTSWTFLNVADSVKSLKIFEKFQKQTMQEAESPPVLMWVWHVTFPDEHKHMVLRSVCQRWPSCTSRPSHTHRLFTHSHPSRYSTRACRFEFWHKEKRLIKSQKDVQSFFIMLGLMKPNILFTTWTLSMSKIWAISSSFFSSLLSLSLVCSWEADFTPWGDPGGPGMAPLCSWSLCMSLGLGLVCSSSLWFVWRLLDGESWWGVWLLSVWTLGPCMSVYWEVGRSSGKKQGSWWKGGVVVRLNPFYKWMTA